MSAAMYKWKNYLTALLFTFAGTLAALASHDPNVYWLWLSDVNVMMALAIAWAFDPRHRQPTEE